MASELHSRLEYLVNYSSQLIFVSGDSIAEQQRTLESFVFQQSDNTELAFITAKPGMQITEYRGTLCKQLLGQVVGSYIRPLNELLAGLNHHEGPVLITITQAQHLPNSFLQELWELVLQSRFANNKQHLNVLLFGESEWAEQAKEWLPAKNTSTPLLISSHSVSTEQYSSDVDRLLAERRAAFERYRRERGEAGALPGADNRLRSPWLWLGIALVFISSFVAIMGWQYGTTMTTLFNPLNEDTASVTPESADSSAPIRPTRTLSIVKQDSGDTLMPEASEVSPVTMPAEVPESTQPQITASTSSQPRVRVMKSFDDAIKAIPAVTSGQNKPVENAQTETPSVPAESSNAPDITATKVGEDTITTEPQPGLTEQATAADSTENSSSALLANDRLANSPAGQYYLQIAGMKDLNLALDFLNDHQLTRQVSIYKTYRYGGDWYVILWSEPADSFAAAQQQLSSLPVFPGSDKAFVKAGAQIKAEIASQP